MGGVMLFRQAHRIWQVLIFVSLFSTSVIISRAQAVKSLPDTGAGFQAQVRQQVIDAKFPEDPELIKLLTPYSIAINDKMNIVIGLAPKVINKEGLAAGNLGGWITTL